MSPIFQAPVTVSLDVQAEELAILVQEGSYHVGGHYSPCSTEANKVRRLEAERRVTQRERMCRLLATCPWCNRTLTEADEPITLGGRHLHLACADAYEREVYGE